jgi:hypothetical protein
MNNCIRYLGPGILLAVVVACGGGSSGDANNDSSTSKLARINAGNAEQLGAAAAEGAKQAEKKATAANVGFRPSGELTVASVSHDLVTRIAGRTANLTPAVYCNPGSATETFNDDGSTSVNFVTCDLFGQGSTILDGLVTASSSVSGDIITVKLAYVGFIIRIGSEESILDFEASCDTNNLTGATSCTFPDVVGYDGRVYDFSEVSVDGDEFSGFSITATIVDPDHGRFTIATTTPIQFTCSNGQPFPGALQFTDGAGVLVTVTFIDCDSYAVSYNSTTAVYYW